MTSEQPQEDWGYQSIDGFRLDENIIRKYLQEVFKTNLNYHVKVRLFDSGELTSAADDYQKWGDGYIFWIPKKLDPVLQTPSSTGLNAAWCQGSDRGVDQPAEEAKHLSGIVPLRSTL